MEAARTRVVVSWSSGKDSAWTLHTLRSDPRYEVVALLTTINLAFDRVAMHAVRRDLLEAQAESVGLPVWAAEIPYPCSNEQYERVMTEVLRRARNERIDAVAFGDLFLEDIRAYRERQMEGTGIAPLFPLWQRDTRALAREMIASGLRARLTCVDPRVLSSTFAGSEFDEDLLQRLPAGVDPCGERGEFHTFVYDGPMFSRPIAISSGDIVNRDGFTFADLSR